MLKKLKILEYSSLYPLFFTLVFILILIQYSFHSLDAIFYDFWVKHDFINHKDPPIILVTLDDDSDQFLGESYPYTYASHLRLVEKLIQSKPSIISFMMTLPEAETLVEQKNQLALSDQLQRFIQSNKGFRFGTEIEGVFGEILPPEPLKGLGYSPAFLFADSHTFSRDEVVRRGILNISGEDSLHLWVANRYQDMMGGEKKDATTYQGFFYNPEADATFALFRYHFNPITQTSIKRIPYHQIVVGNFDPENFKDKIVLIGPEYIANAGDFSLTPFNKDELKASKMAVHANLISAFLAKDTIYAVHDNISKILSILIAIILSFIISRVQPTRGLMITIGIMLGVFLSGFLIFSLFGLWIKLSHIILGIFVVYYIWVPFRAIEEYQTRYAIQEEAKLLKQVDNLKQNFISLMSHDLKTPVAKIAGIADILKVQYPNTPDQGKLLENIVQSTKELNSFITSILDLTKIESQNLTLKKESKDVNKIIEAIALKLKFEATAQEMEIELDLSPLYPITVDVILMNRVISNLIENAIKYAGKGKKISIKTWDDKDWVYLEIKDNGAGIKPQDLEHIFDKFYRVKNDTSHSIKGSGLGLYLVKYFIELHEGAISASSEFGKGTSFIIKLTNQ
jgi:signal transduction histidine kinase